MNKKVISAAVVLILLCAAGIIIWLISGRTAVAEPVAEIYSDGVLVRIIDLSTEECFIVECDSGFNTILVKEEKISVIDADCPDKVCMRTGAISSGGIPIICLPHRLEIKIASSEELDGQIR